MGGAGAVACGVRVRARAPACVSPGRARVFDTLAGQIYDSTRGEHVLDKLRKRFAGGPPGAGGLAPLGVDPPSRPRPPARGPQPASPPSDDSSGSVRPSLASTPAEAPPVEVPCPSCGEPMLPGWGSTCGKCRPNLVAPKTLFQFAGLPAPPLGAPGGMTLGWLVVIRAADETRQGTLIELDRPTVVLSRAGAAPLGADEVVEFQDSFMSSGHAVLRAPSAGDRDGAFTIADRDNPSPSANGTFVSSHKLKPGEVMRLSDGDVIKVGATELLFKSLWLPPSGRRP